jgi:hypothetical protein
MYLSLHRLPAMLRVCVLSFIAKRFYDEQYGQSHAARVSDDASTSPIGSILEQHRKGELCIAVSNSLTRSNL